MNPDWTLLALSLLFFAMAANSARQQGTIGKARSAFTSARATLKVRWRLATMSKAEADILYLLADEAWEECDQSADPRIGSGVRSPIERHRTLVSYRPEVVDMAIEKLRAVAS